VSDKIQQQRFALGQVMRATVEYFSLGGRPEAIYAAITGVWEGHQRPAPSAPVPVDQPKPKESEPRDGVHHDWVMSFDEWCKLNGFSRSTGMRIVAAGKGPQFIQLSERRKGVTVSENRRWQQTRFRYQ
jgi:predicted DNA-binding transcriptional regulator AlpA